MSKQKLINIDYDEGYNQGLADGSNNNKFFINGRGRDATGKNNYTIGYKEGYKNGQKRAKK
ncbi:MAG: hypothetical protein WCO55_01500 [Candidatus Falkowbacteria bacterium]